MNKEEIKEILPHREPMLLVDDVTLEADGTSVGHYTVSGDEFFLQGHFPGNPIVPGVILCEMCAQSAAVMFMNDISGKTPVYTGINNVKFRRPVRPGEAVEFRCTLTRARAPFYFISGNATVNGEKAMSGDFSFALT